MNRLHKIYLVLGIIILAGLGFFLVKTIHAGEYTFSITTVKNFQSPVSLNGANIALYQITNNSTTRPNNVNMKLLYLTQSDPQQQAINAQLLSSFSFVDPTTVAAAPKLPNCCNVTMQNQTCTGTLGIQASCATAIKFAPLNNNLVGLTAKGGPAIFTLSGYITPSEQINTTVGSQLATSFSIKTLTPKLLRGQMQAGAPETATYLITNTSKRTVMTPLMIRGYLHDHPSSPKPVILAPPPPWPPGTLSCWTSHVKIAPNQSCRIGVLLTTTADDAGKHVVGGPEIMNSDKTYSKADANNQIDVEIVKAPAPPGKITFSAVDTHLTYKGIKVANGTDLSYQITKPPLSSSLISICTSKQDCHLSAADALRMCKYEPTITDPNKKSFMVPKNSSPCYIWFQANKDKIKGILPPKLRTPLKVTLNAVPCGNCDATPYSATVTLNYKQYLYAGGIFDNANIARWDGAAWKLMSGLGFRSDPYPLQRLFCRPAKCTGIYALATYQGDLYAAGMIGSAKLDGSNTYTTINNGIVRWDGKNWSKLGSAKFNNTSKRRSVYALAAYEDRLYMGGNFNLSLSNTNILHNFASWGPKQNSTEYSWDSTPVGKTGNAYLGMGFFYVSPSARTPGIYPVVRALTVSTLKGSSVLYVGGYFNTVNSPSAPVLGNNHIAAWNGSGWSWPFAAFALYGVPIPSGIYGMTEYTGKLIASTDRTSQTYLCVFGYFYRYAGNNFRNILCLDKYSGAHRVGNADSGGGLVTLGPSGGGWIEGVHAMLGNDDASSGSPGIYAGGFFNGYAMKAKDYTFRQHFQYPALVFYNPNGTSPWSSTPMISTASMVYALTTDGPRVYVGGSFNGLMPGSSQVCNSIASYASGSPTFLSNMGGGLGKIPPVVSYHPGDTIMMNVDESYWNMPGVHTLLVVPTITLTVSSQ